MLVLRYALLSFVLSTAVFGFKYKALTPSSISPEAQGVFKSFHEIIAGSGHKLFDQMPEPFDYTGWGEKFVAGENDDWTKQTNDAAIEKYKPKLEELSLNGTRVLRVTPQNVEAHDQALIYIHGGGFTLGTPESQKICAIPLAHMTGLPIFMINYGRAPILSPEGMWEKIEKAIIEVEHLGYKRSKIGIYGDSAGANLALRTLLNFREVSSDDMFGAVAFISPWLDLSGSGDTYQTLEPYDPILSAEALSRCARAYAGSECLLNNLLASPLFEDFSGKFLPVLIQVGTREMLLSDSLRLAQKLKDAGQSVVLSTYEGMWHDFQLFSPDLPESQKALKELADFFKKHL